MPSKKQMTGNTSYLPAMTSLLFGICCGIFVYSLTNHVVDTNSSSPAINSESVTIPMTTFNGEQWITPSTMSITTLASNKYGQFQSHNVKTESGQVFISFC